LTSRGSNGVAERAAPRSSAAGERGWSLVEVLVALCLVGSVGVLASGVAHSLARLVRAAKAEAAGLSAATDRLETMIATERSRRDGGNDEVLVGDVAVARVWRVVRDTPAAGVDRLEVTVRWSHPALTLLTLVAVAP
jgi:type II secretory pathway pseudopilin PulG